MSESEKAAYDACLIINWYLGNFIGSPNNSLRDDGLYFEELEQGKTDFSSILGRAKSELDMLREELKGRKMTHREFMALVRERGIHARYYKYKRYETACAACSALGFRQR